MKNGAFQIARKLFDSELWNKKPASWTKIWIYILGRVNYKDNGKFKRGEGFFNFAQEYKDMGSDITKDKIKKFTKYALQEGMISTHRSTRGLYIKVLKYPIYQDLSNYQAPVEAPQKSFSGTSKALPKHHDNKERKKEKKEEEENTHITDFFQKKPPFQELMERYCEKGMASKKVELEFAKFTNYWTEPNQKGKQKWQLEKTFSIPHRLKTWFLLSDKFKK